MTPTHLTARLERVADEYDIRQLHGRYCRGVDRLQFDLVRACYHADAIDEHGDFVGGLDDFIAFIDKGLRRYERTMHFLGTMNIEIDGSWARSEAYAIAFHRVPVRAGRPVRDHVVGLRYLDDLERRAGEWRIAHRICAFDWTRTDPVPSGWEFSEGFRRGRRDRGDPVFARTLAELIAAPVPPSNGPDVRT
jgi:hypothetical protein